MSGLVEAAIEEALGPRCLDYDQDCTGCKTWAEFDRLTARVAELEGALEPFARLDLLQGLQRNVGVWLLFPDDIRRAKAVLEPKP